TAACKIAPPRPRRHPEARMIRLKGRWLALLTAFTVACYGQSSSSQPAELTPEVSIHAPAPIPFVDPILRPFEVRARMVSPAILTDSPRLQSLIRAGNLYLTEQDVIALALENNLDIAIQRYGPPLAREVVRRAEAGAALRNIGQPISPGP